MLMYIFIFLIALIFNLNAFAGQPAIGFVMSSENGYYELQTFAKIEATDTVVIQTPMQNGSISCCTPIEYKNITAIKTAAEIKGLNGDDFLKEYKLKINKKRYHENPFIGVALINVKKIINSNEWHVTAKLKNNKIVTVRKCVDGGGVYLKPSKNFNTEAIYYNAGYDIDLNSIEKIHICKINY